MALAEKYHVGAPDPIEHRPVARRFPLAGEYSVGFLSRARDRGELTAMMKNAVMKKEKRPRMKHLHRRFRVYYNSFFSDNVFLSEREFLKGSCRYFYPFLCLLRRAAAFASSGSLFSIFAEGSTGRPLW
jgi:hypothetical protein